ncbi:MAG: adenylate/guanylate cyclase domain-containing protein [Nostocaceae cyanobacterium]|nr:adenylate/guanylate cyclase domain-containing protein [Nostocaceae cyanobacterium]
MAVSNMSHLSMKVIESQALMNAKLQAQSILDAWRLYSTTAADRIKKIPGVNFTNNYLVEDKAVPNPATYAIELGQTISQKQGGMSVRIYSDYPFPWRKAEGGVKNEFEQEALNYFRKHPEQTTFYRLEKSQNHNLWRYGQAIIMERSCVACHNTLPDSPKKDWRVGEVRGVLAITQSLDRFMKKTDQNLQITSAMLGGLSLLGLLGLSLVFGRLRQTAQELELRVEERTRDLAQANTDLETRNQLIRQVFGRYLSNEIVANLLESPEALKLGGQRRKITILTSDLRGFTATSQRLSAEEVIRILNIYLEYMADIITQYQGTINEFMGDGILVLFGAPSEREDDASRAVACAVAMQLAMDAVNEKLQKLGFPQLEMGIGINTGLVVLGNIGSEKRTKYGVVGSDVNLTYRIESYTMGGEILISESTLKDVESIVKISGQRQVKPKGVKQTITVHQVYGISGPYNLFLSVEEEVFFPLDEAIPIEYQLLEGKNIGEYSFNGNLVELSAKGAKVDSQNVGDKSLPSALTNIKLNFLTQYDPQWRSEDIYAKVLKGSAEPGSFYIYFTAKPPAVQARLDKLYKSIQMGNG